MVLRNAHGCVFLTVADFATVKDSSGRDKMFCPEPEETYLLLGTHEELVMSHFSSFSPSDPFSVFSRG